MTKPDKVVKTHSSAIQITHRGSLVQHKAWLVMLRNAYNELQDPKVKKHKMRVSELSGYLKITNQKRLKSLLEELVKKTVKWNILGKDGEAEWGAAGLLAGCKISKGLIEYDYSSILREKLYNPEMFALLSMNILNKFKSKYSLALYSICKDYSGVFQTPFMNLDTFREFMGLEKHEYTDFKRLNVRVIKQPLEEVNTLSDINIRVEYKRENRKVVGLKFHIKDNPQIKIDFEKMADEVMQLSSAGEEVLTRLVSFGITEKQAEKLLKTHDESYITENLDVVEKQCQAGNIDSVPAFTMAAMKHDYRPKKTLLDTKKEAKKAEDKARIASSNRRDKLDRLKEDFEIQRLESALNNLPEAERKRMEQEFVEAKKKEKGGSFVLGYYRQSGFDHIVVKGVFHAYAKGKLLTEPFPIGDFRAYMKTQGYKPGEYKKELKDLNA